MMHSGWIALFLYLTGFMSVLLIGEPASLKHKSALVSGIVTLALAAFWWLLAWLVIGTRVGEWVKRKLRGGPSA